MPLLSRLRILRGSLFVLSSGFVLSSSLSSVLRATSLMHLILVDYENVSLANIAENDNYYFASEGNYHFADPKGFNDCLTSSSLTLCRSDFRSDIFRRDGGRCVITAYDGDECDAAHIIPLSKGDEYINFIISDRSILYQDDQLPPLDINSTQNGVLVNKQLHARFGLAKSAFLKTPNFALDCVDVPRVETGTTPTYRVTIQHLTSHGGVLPVLQSDVLPDWSGPLAPPSILLDYMYGVAAIKRWAANNIRPLLDDRHEQEFRTILPVPPPSSLEADDDSHLDDTTDTVDADDAPPGTGRRRGIHHKSKESELSRAMDFAFRFSMFLKGHAPGTTLAMVREKQEEAAELHSRQVGVARVQSWLEERVLAQSETSPQHGHNWGVGTDQPSET